MRQCEGLLGLRFLKFAKGALHLASFNIESVGTSDTLGQGPVCVKA